MEHTFSQIRNTVPGPLSRFVIKGPVQLSAQQDAAGHDGEAATTAKGSKKTPRGSRGGRKSLDRQMRKAMDANLRELELMHKRVCILLYARCIPPQG